MTKRIRGIVRRALALGTFIFTWYALSAVETGRAGAEALALLAALLLVLVFIAVDRSARRRESE